MRKVLIIELDDSRYEQTVEARGALVRAIRNFEGELNNEVFVYFEPSECSLRTDGAETEAKFVTALVGRGVHFATVAEALKEASE